MWTHQQLLSISKRLSCSCWMTTECFWVLMKDLWNKKRIDLSWFSTRPCNDVITMQPSLPHTSCCGCPTWSAGGSLTLWQTCDTGPSRAEPRRLRPSCWASAGLPLLRCSNRNPKPTVSLSFSKLYINDHVQVTLIDLKKRIFIEFTLWIY